MGAIYVECSSKEMNGVHEVFELAVTTAVGREIKMQEERERLAAHGGGNGGGGVGMIGGWKKRDKKRCPIL